MHFLKFSLIIVLVFVLVVLFGLYYLSGYTHSGEKKDIKEPFLETSISGEKEYPFQGIESYKFGQGDNKYWIFIPKNKNLNELPVILFVHGWAPSRLREPEYRVHEYFISHIVEKGNILIYPIYQRGFLGPLPGKYVSNVIEATKKALLRIERIAPKNNFSKFSIIGYSIGGTIATNLIGKEDIPLPKAVILIEPSEGLHLPLLSIPFSNLKKVRRDIFFTVMVGKDDKLIPLQRTVKKLSLLSSNIKNRYFFEIQSDFYGNPPLVANHIAFLGSWSNREVVIDAMDYAYQKIIDSTLNCAFFGKDCNLLESDNLPLGFWSDGKKIKQIKKIRIANFY